jgi:DNA-binding NarL/FixJ family response regulator
LEDSSAVDQLFESSLEAWPDGFDGARTRLAWGESLVRRGNASQAVPLLDDAVSELGRLGARPWEQRARAAIGAAGASAPAPVLIALSALTGQELQVALAVADGLRNREAAERLFMSPKTVEHHLSRIYAKLGLRSRTELTRIALASNASRG